MKILIEVETGKDVSENKFQKAFCDKRGRRRVQWIEMSCQSGVSKQASYRHS